MRRNSWTAGLSSISAVEASGRRHLQRRYGDGLLGAAPEGDARGHQEQHRRQVVEDAGHGCRAVGAGVDVVEHDQRTLVGRDLGLGVADHRLHGGVHVVAGLPIGHLVEVHHPSGLVTQPGRRDGRDAGLAAAAEAGQGDQPGVGLLEAPDDAVDQLLAPVRRGARRRQPGGRARHRVVAEVGVASGVLEEDRRLDALEGLARLDAQLVGHHGPRLGVHLESLLGAVLAMQRSHQLTPEPLARGVLASGRAQLVDRLGAPGRAGRAARNDPRSGCGAAP